MAANTWAVVPVAAALETLNPSQDPTLNPNHPTTWPEYMSSNGWSGIMNAWCGACYDHTRDELHLPLQGGHADYAGNDALKLSLRQEAPAWTRLHPPSGYNGAVTTNDGQEATGLYSDGRARAIHSYNKPVWATADDAPWIAVQGNTSWGAQAGKYWPVRVDREAGTHQFGAVAAADVATATSGGAAAYDQSRNAIWWCGRGGSKLGKYDIALNTWTGYTRASIAGPLGMVYLPGHDCLFIANLAYGDCRVHDCATGSHYALALTGTPAGGLLSEIGESQPHYVPSMDAIVWWNHSTERDHLSYAPVPADPRAGPWVAQKLAPGGTNAVTPSARNANGTYGRFAYAPNLGGFVLTHLPTGPVWFYALT